MFMENFMCFGKLFAEICKIISVQKLLGHPVQISDAANTLFE